MVIAPAAWPVAMTLAPLATDTFTRFPLASPEPLVAALPSEIATIPHEWGPLTLIAPPWTSTLTFPWPMRQPAE